MKLLLKHLLRSIRQKPLQPIILLLTLTLAMATAIFAFTLDDMIADDIDAAQSAKYGNASLMIRVGNSSDSRFLFVDDVIDVLGEDVKAVGAYDLPLILDQTDTTIAVATEFERFSEIFSVEFSEYGHMTKSTVGEVAFVSEEFAAQKGLSLGDTLSVDAMGYAKEYRIEGIASDRFLGSYDVMVDIRSVVREFSQNSLLFAAIGDDFKPCGRIYLNLDACEGMTEENAIALLKADERFSEKTFEGLLEIEKRQSNPKLLEVIVSFSVAIAAMLSAVVAFCCLYILSNERSEENLVLAYSGAGPGLLGVMQYMEVILYWLLSLPLAIVAAIPMTKIIAKFVYLQYAEVTVYASTVLKSALLILAVCLLTTSFFVFFYRRIKKTGATHTTLTPKWVWLLSLLIAVLLAVLYLSPAAFRVKIYAVIIGALVAWILLATPMILRGIARSADRKLQNARGSAVLSFRYALKNICSMNLLHNIARLCALVVSIMLTIALVFTCANGWMKAWQHVFCADFAIANATDRCYEKAQSCESAELVSRSYMGLSEYGAVLSADDLSVYGDFLCIDQQPTGNEAIISAGVAHSLDIRKGDRFVLEIDGAEYELVVADVKWEGLNYIALNCEDLGIPYNMLLVTGRDGVSSAELLADLSEVTSTELAAITSAESLMEQRVRVMQTYVNSGTVLLCVFSGFSLIGISNIVYESLRSRREEFGYYRIAGMSRKSLRQMKLWELAITLALGALIGCLTFLVVAVAVNRGMSGVGAEIFLGIRLLFA